MCIRTNFAPYIRKRRRWRPASRRRFVAWQTGQASPCQDRPGTGRLQAQSGCQHAGGQKAGGTAGRQAVMRKVVRSRRQKGRNGKKSDFPAGAETSDNPDVLYGRILTRSPCRSTISSARLGEVVIRAGSQLWTTGDQKRRTILIFDVTDFSDTMTIKMFLQTIRWPELTGM